MCTTEARSASKKKLLRETPCALRELCVELACLATFRAVSTAVHSLLQRGNRRWRLPEMFPRRAAAIAQDFALRQYPPRQAANLRLVELEHVGRRTRGPKESVRFPPRASGPI